MKKISYIIIFILVGCTAGYKTRNVEEYYASTGVEKYFLSEIPEWANFSQSAGCFRTKGLRYFDIVGLMKSYSLSYNNAIQIQALFNEEYQAVKEKPNVTLTLKDEEVLFFKASEKVNSKITFFEAPAFKQIHLIWLDEALKDKKHEDKLKSFLLSSVHDVGVPVIVSACLSKHEIEKRFPDMAIKMISAEMFSIYDENGEKQPNMHINLDAFFKPEQKLILYTQDTKKNVEDIRGNYKVAHY